MAYSREEIADLIKTILIKNHFYVDGGVYGISKNDITNEADLKNDFGIGSLEKMGLIIEVEHMFNMMEIPDTDIEKLITFGDLVDYVYKSVLTQKINKNPVKQIGSSINLFLFSKRNNRVR